MNPPSNGTFTAVPSVLSNGTVLTVQCHFGFLSTGDSSLVCVNGVWLGEAECTCELLLIFCMTACNGEIVTKGV